MTIPFWCLLVAIVIPYVLGGVVGYARVQQFGTLDNKYPRIQQASLQGLGARAQAAENNAFEALPVFGAAVFVAHLAGADPGRSALLAEVFLGARILHAIFYLANVDTLRSLVFVVGFACCIGLFVISA